MAFSEEDVEGFLDSFQGFRERPSTQTAYMVEGSLPFSATLPGGHLVNDSFDIRIEIPRTQRVLPLASEVGGRIPKEADFHVNPDGSLCLGSPLALNMAVGRDRSLAVFVDRCLIPYLAAISIKLVEGGDLPLPDLAHGKAGLLEEYERLLGVHGEQNIKAMLRLGGQRKRVANKQLCPCGCAERVRRCPSRTAIERLRKSIGRRCLRDVLANLDRM